MTETIRIGNCSGFYGDRLSAFREMLEGGPLDYLTGDYLAELTMLILGKDTFKDPSLGYARTFVKQAEDALGLALERDVKVVVNAGGINPRGLADKLREVATGLGLDPRIAHVEGDDIRGQVAGLGLLHETYGNPLTANAYLGGFGIAAALDRGADVVVTGRVTDASVVVGPAIAHFGWTPESYDALAGAVVAGHIIECGTQATGGNFSGFLDLISTGSITMDRPLGFPIAELAEDGSMVITKHDGTGGAVTVDTVTAQLVYEIQSTQYLNPDVTVDLTSLQLEQAGADRVAVTGVTGTAPPEQLKVCLNYFAGFRNSAEFVRHRPRRRRQGRVDQGPGRGRARADGAKADRPRSSGPASAPCSPTPTPRRAPRCCCGSPRSTRAPTRSARASPHRSSSSRSPPTLVSVSPGCPAPARRTASTGRPTSRATSSSTPSSTTTGRPRSSPIPRPPRRRSTSRRASARRRTPRRRTS